MQAVWQISKYIVQNNAPWQIPFKFLAAFFWQIEKRLLKRSRIKTLFNGARVYLTPQNPSASCLVYADYPDKPALMALRNLANKNTVFLDIGANIGFYSLLMQDKVNQVYAFEAHPDTLALLTKNFELNNIDLKHIVPKAVSNKNGPMFFSNLKSGSPINRIVAQSASNNTIKVQATTLDEFMSQQACPQNAEWIIKLDVEGAEQWVLEGAQHTLKHYPVKAILFESLSPKTDKVPALLQVAGFEIQSIMKNNYLAIKRTSE